MRPPQCLSESISRGDHASIPSLIQAIGGMQIPQEEQAAVNGFLERIKDYEFVTANKLTAALDNEES